MACPMVVGPYDGTTDQMTTSLQVSVDSFLEVLATDTIPHCTFPAQKSFYAHIGAAANTLTIRNQARPKNDLTTQQIVLLDSSLALLTRYHQGKGDHRCMTAGEIAPLRQNLDVTFGAILKLELAKKS